MAKGSQVVQFSGFSTVGRRAAGVLAAPSLALVLGLAAVSAASADTVLLEDGMMDHARTVNISGIGNVSAAPVQFDALLGGQQVDLLAWCVDVYHSISLQDYKPDLKYTDDNTLTTDFNNKPLDAGDAVKVGLLVNYGDDVFADMPVAPPAFTEHKPNRHDFPNGSAGTHAYNTALAIYNADKAAHDTAVANYNTAVNARYTLLSAVQSAIWQVVSDRNVTSTNHDHSFDNLVDDLSGDNLTNYFTGGYGPEGSDFTLITPVQLYGGRNGTTPLALTQSFAIAGGGAVPEPAAWALMIAGFGMAGAMLRRSRRSARALA
jgi:hypothetical protein